MLLLLVVLPPMVCVCVCTSCWAQTLLADLWPSGYLTVGGCCSVACGDARPPLSYVVWLPCQMSVGGLPCMHDQMPSTVAWLLCCLSSKAGCPRGHGDVTAEPQQLSLCGAGLPYMPSVLMHTSVPCFRPTCRSCLAPPARQTWQSA
jgi:hypothetical protein